MLDGADNKRRSGLDEAAIVAGVVGTGLVVGVGLSKLWRWIHREETPVSPPNRPTARAQAPSSGTHDGVIRPDFSGFRRSKSSASSTPSTPSTPSPPRPAPEPEVVVEPWMREWAAKVAEGMGIKI